MSKDSMDKIIQFRVTVDEMNEIKLICYDKTQKWDRVYTTSDFVRDGISLMKAYHNVKDSLLANQDVLPDVLHRLTNGRH